MRIARENPTWGYRRIVGELRGLGIGVSASSVRAILVRHRLPPAPERDGLSWRLFLRQQAATMLACDFLTVETVWLTRIYVLFFVSLERRRVEFVASTNPDGRWVAQQARNLLMLLADREQSFQFLLHDRDSKFGRAFDEVFRSEGLRIIRTPVRAPNANAYAERWVGTLRRESLDRIPILNRRHLDHVLRVYTAKSSVRSGANSDDRNDGPCAPASKVRISRPVHEQLDDERFGSVRGAFPITQRRSYLFAGGMAPLSRPGREALEAYGELCASDPVAAYREYPPRETDRLRATVAQFVSARPEEIAILDSTSRGNNLAVQMIDARPGANVVVDSTTYPSALFPWLLPAKAHVEIRRVPDQRGLPVVEAFERLVDKRTAAISVSHVCRLTGFRHHLRSLSRLAHEVGAFLLVDAAQSVGAVQIDVEEAGADVMAFGAMKWLLGTPGIGFLYVRPSLAERFALPQAGPAGARRVGGKIAPAVGSLRHELSSLHWGGLAASRRGMELLLEPGLEAVERRVLWLSGLLIGGLRERGIEVWTPTEPERRAGIVAFRHRQPDALRLHLRELGVDVWGWQDRELMRADPHVYNVAADIERLLDGLDAFGG